MSRKLYIGLLCFLVFYTSKIWAQYPQYFGYSDVNGLPSNEVYNIIQDEKGFIWIGSDAGLFKFDGIRYHPYKSSTQKSKAVSGLTISKSGRLYCHNFQSQIFYLEDDQLKELEHPYSQLSTIISDETGKLFVNHINGLAVYDEIENQWVNYEPETNFPPGLKKMVTQSVRINNKNEAVFITETGIGLYINDQLEYYNLDSDYKKSSASGYIVEWYKSSPWLFSVPNKNKVYRFFNGEFQEIHDQKLLGYLANNQINKVRQLNDGNLWICTYNGVIRYNPITQESELFYPEMTISDCIIDREGNYWFTSLQYGLIRVIDLDYIVWNNFDNIKLSKLTTDGTDLYFASVNGDLGMLNPREHILNIISTGSKSDIQTLNYVHDEKTVYVYTYRNLFKFDGAKLRNRAYFEYATKYLDKYNGEYFLSSSSGLFLFDPIISDITERLYGGWARETKYNANQNVVWVASNEGLLRYENINGRWKLIQKLMPGIQFLSIDYDDKNERIYALQFDGILYEVGHDNQMIKIGDIPNHIQTYRIKYYDGKVYVASNHGVFILDKSTRRLQNLSTFNGLTSNSVLDLLILNNELWLATGGGLQKLPLNSDASAVLAKVYLKNMNFNPKSIKLKSAEALVIYPEASIYSGGGKFEYAYRINGKEWIKLPSSIEKIDIPNLPLGSFKLDLKVIDHLGRDSENIIHLEGYVKPYFWQTWWFYLLLGTSFVFLVFYASRKVIQNIRKREKEKNALLKSQLTAIRAQMNPHFMYNTLNSIQDLILQQDFKSTNYYLSRFSQLMRQILNFSEQERILLSEELDMLDNYLKLEELRFGDDFHYEINCDGKIDCERSYIPSMLLQPFVENAIKHGLLHKKGQKNLEISFSHDQGKLFVEIEDNGVGRQKSTEIKKKRNLNHKSFASEAVLNRVKLLNKSGRYKILVKIEDVNPQIEDTGTRVKIQVTDLNVDKK